jgi:hypothetical protein
MSEKYRKPLGSVSVRIHEAVLSGIVPFSGCPDLSKANCRLMTSLSMISTLEQGEK